MAKYLLRFDDICPTMNWTVWEQIEPILQRHQVRPILSIVPDNRDPHLQVCPLKTDFWEWAYQRQQDGWVIAIHGYQHLYETTHSGILGIHPRSEFAGLPLEKQQDKLRKALAIFHDNHLYPRVFVAPSHSFDEVTLRVLRENDIDVISDGFFLNPVRWNGLVWIPQQMWRFRRMPFGVWTVCYHHNAFQESDLQQFRDAVARFAGRIISLQEALQSVRDGNLGDMLFHHLWRRCLLLRLNARRLKRFSRRRSSR